MEYSTTVMLMFSFSICSLMSSLLLNSRSKSWEYVRDELACQSQSPSAWLNEDSDSTSTWLHILSISCLILSVMWCRCIFHMPSSTSGWIRLQNSLFFNFLNKIYDVLRFWPAFRYKHGLVDHNIDSKVKWRMENRSCITWWVCCVYLQCEIFHFSYYEKWINFHIPQHPTM